MKKINVTFSLPSDTHKFLRFLVRQRKMSFVVANILDEALKQNLQNGYAEAAQDFEQQRDLQRWDVLDTEN